MKTAVVIIPTFNESGNIESLIKRVEEVCRNLREYSWKILVVDDYSPDGTANIVRKLSQKYKNVTLISKNKEGLGAAYVFGMNYALDHFQPDLFVQMDADWQHDPSLLPQFIKKIENGADLVVGSRYMTGGSIPSNWGLHRKIYSIVGNNIVRFGLGMLSPHDWTSGYRMIKTDVYRAIQKGLSTYSGYTYQVVFLHRAKLQGFNIDEIPLKFIDRIHGKSKIAPYEYIRNLLMYIFNHSTFIKYVIIGILGFLIQAGLSKLFIVIGLNEGISVMLGSIGAIICNFLGNNFWVFAHRRIQGFANYFKKFIHFLGTSIGAVIIQGVVVSIGVLFLGHNAWFFLMVFAIVFLVIPYNYFIYNRFIWKTHQKKE